MTVEPYVTIQQIDPPGPSVRALLGDGYPKPSADGGWETLSRPKDVGFINWAGQQPHTMDVPILLDGWAADRSVEHELSVLYNMTRVPVGQRDEPPVVQLSGPIVMATKRWVIQNLDYVDEIRRESDGQRVRASLTVSLLEHIDPDILVAFNSAAKRGQHRDKHGGKVGATRRYVVRHGDTLPTIAQRTLHNSKLWHDIAKLNGLRDPKNLKVGQTLRIP